MVRNTHDEKRDSERVGKRHEREKRKEITATQENKEKRDKRKARGKTKVP